jgi:hypothetical protein
MGNLREDEMSTVARKYTPVLKDFELVKWVIKARSLDTQFGSWALLKVLSEDGRLICTDGHRLHIVTLHDPLPNGIWEVQTDKKREISLVLDADPNGMFPKWREILPERNYKIQKSRDVFTDGNPDEIRLGQTLAQIIRFLSVDMGVQPRFIRDLGEGNWVLDYYGKGKPFSLACHGDETFRRAVIMPLRCDA